MPLRSGQRTQRRAAPQNSDAGAAYLRALSLLELDAYVSGIAGTGLDSDFRIRLKTEAQNRFQRRLRNTEKVAGFWYTFRSKSGRVQPSNWTVSKTVVYGEAMSYPTYSNITTLER